jgi:hypothetical protein
MGALKSSHQSSIWFLSTSRLQLESEVCHCPLVQGGGQVCCFCLAAATLPLQLQLWLVSSSTSKVGQFSFEYKPQSHETSSVIHYAPLWEVGLSPHPWSQPLLLFLPSFTESSDTCSTLFSKAGSVFHPTLTVGVRLPFTVSVFQLYSEGFQSAQGLH